MPFHQIENSTGNYNYNAFIYENCRWDYHFHKNYEIVYVMSGSITAQIDFREENLGAGTFALILPNQLHSFVTPDSSSVWIGVFSEDYVFQFAAQTRNIVGCQSAFSCSDIIRDFVVHYLIDEGTRDIYLLKSCLYALCSAYKKNTAWISRTAGRDNLLFQIVDYVAENFKSDITLRKLSEQTGFEYHYLSRRFHDIFGINFCRFVNQYRINYANELLSQNPESITSVAFECGFQSVRSFNLAYKQLTGTVPTKNKAP